MNEQKKKYHHGDLRGALLEAIRSLVERDGPDGFKIAEACRMAGVSTAAPYKHFADRDEMLRGVALGGMQRLYAGMLEAVEAHPAGDPARIAAMGQSYVNFAKNEPGVFRLMFALAEDHKDDVELSEMGDDANALVERVVAEHLHIEEGSVEVRLRAYALWCFVHGHCFLTLDGKTDPLPAETEAQLLALVGAAMLPENGDTSGQ